MELTELRVNQLHRRNQHRARPISTTSLLTQLWILPRRRSTASRPRCQNTCAKALQTWIEAASSVQASKWSLQAPRDSSTEIWQSCSCVRLRLMNLTIRAKWTCRPTKTINAQLQFANKIRLLTNRRHRSWSRSLKLYRSETKVLNQTENFASQMCKHLEQSNLMGLALHRLKTKKFLKISSK